MTRRRTTPRWGSAAFGLFAVLVQAILFGWHHHDLSTSGRLPAPVFANAAAPQPAADDEDGCEICQVLHHLTAAPPDHADAPPPFEVAATAEAGIAVLVRGGVAAGFHARAPPSSVAVIG
jgi:hypothetical protein